MPSKIFSSIDIANYKQDMDALFKYEKPKRVPNGNMWYCAEFSIRNTGQNIAEVFHDVETIYDAICWTTSQYRWNPFLQYTGFSVHGCHDFGGTMIYPTKNGEFLTPSIHPVKNESDVEKLTLPDPYTAGDIPRQLKFAKLKKKSGFPVGFMTHAPFSMAAMMCGINLLMTWLLEKPALCEHLMEMAYNHVLRVLDVWVKTFGVENLQVWWTAPIESNQLISPKHMEKFALPYHLKFGNHLKEIGVHQFLMHLCGDQNRNLPILAEADPWSHPAILSFGPEVDIINAAEQFPQDIIYGNVDTILLEKGKPKDIFDTCKGILEKGKNIEGGFIIASGCDTPVLTPPCNMYAMTKAVDEYGVY